MTPRSRIPAAAKVNLALVVGPLRLDGKHEVATVLQRVDLCDRVTLEEAPELEIVGFDGDTLVRAGLELLAREADAAGRWRVTLEKRIPLAAGLGGGSADAAAALVLASRTLARPMSGAALARIAAQLGSDVPFFLTSGPKLGEGTGERLTPLDLPQDYWVLVALPANSVKPSTGAVYARFDELGGGSGFPERREQLLEALRTCRRARDLARLPLNDLAEAAGRTELPERLRALGAFRADLSGAGPTVYGLFHHRSDATRAATRLPPGTRAWVVPPVW